MLKNTFSASLMYRSCYHSYWDTLKSTIWGWGEWDETHNANFHLPTGHAACVVETPVSFICVHERGISSCFGNRCRIVRTKVRSHSAEKGFVRPFSKCPESCDIHKCDGTGEGGEFSHGLPQTSSAFVIWQRS